jgi:sulfane dehydrogenase subunit SoxC
MEPKQSSRRQFLEQVKQGTMLAGLAAVGGIQVAKDQSSGQSGSAQLDGHFNPPSEVATPPEAAILRDPWNGTPLRDAEGNVLADWTGTEEWNNYQKGVRATGGPAYGTREKDYRMYGYRSRFVTTVRTGTNGTGCPAPSTVRTPFLSLGSPLQDQTGIITPTALHFMDEHGWEPPDIDPRQHRLMIHGMVERPLIFTMEELQRLPSVSRIHFIECNSNGTPSNKLRIMPQATPQDINGEYSCSEWTGVLLSTLLDMVGVQKGASWIWAEPQDKLMHTKSVPLWKAMDDCIVCYGQNGEPLRPEQGFPIRLLTPGFEGTTNIKRLRRIEVTNEPGMFWRETGVGYTHLRPDGKARWFQVELAPKSIILRPSGGQRLTSRGFYEMRGLAWSGGGKVSRVEITTDGGRSWKDARIQEPVLSKAATRFVFPWDWNGEEVMLASRCTDERGTTQPTLAQLAKVWGVEPDYFRNPRGPVWRFNVIQPWKIDSEGKVTNAIFSI